MPDFSRRRFLIQIGTFAGLFLANQNAFASPSKDNSEPFELLVIGDSLVWGQGLEEKDKFYSLTKNWLENDLFDKSRKVNLQVKAHSGATIFLHEKESKFLEKAGKDESPTVIPEISLPFPTLKWQIDDATKEYEAAGKSVSDVDLVMLTGGLVDITVAGILNPFGNDNILRKDIVKYCREDMSRFLDYATNVFPKAKFVVIAYFPILSPKTPAGKMLNDMLEAFDFPLVSKPLANNILTRPFFAPFRKKALKRSRIWFEESTRELQTAVNLTNKSLKADRIIFVKSPLTEETAFETADSKLFKMGRRGKAEDAFYDLRVAQCKPQLAKLKKEYGLKLPTRQCEVAGIGHPNVKGSKAYAEAIIENLKLILGEQ